MVAIVFQAPLYRFEKWGTLHKHPYEKISVPRGQWHIFCHNRRRSAEILLSSGKTALWKWIPGLRYNYSVQLFRNIKKTDADYRFFKKYTSPSLLDKLRVIECFEQPGRVLKVGEMLDGQRRLYHETGVRPLGSSWIGWNIGLISCCMWIDSSMH